MYFVPAEHSIDFLPELEGTPAQVALGEAIRREWWFKWSNMEDMEMELHLQYGVPLVDKTFVHDIILRVTNAEWWIEQRLNLQRFFEA
ncbi:MAG: hypothetical protein DDT34_02213 [Firmicutes bacterium]|nr:hypothetical protein [Bacillota bacterium]